MTQTMTQTNIIRNKLNEDRPRSKWGKAVLAYANELLDTVEEEIEYYRPNLKISEKALLNGAEDWGSYSEGGNSLIYYEDIAERFCTPSELKKCKGGSLPLSDRESWMEIQARALFQASKLILNQVTK